MSDNHPVATSFWRLNPHLSWSLDRPRLLGILNTTPDSFSDGGMHPSPSHAAAAAEAMLDQGADGIDIGGESTRPGAKPVPPREQIRRVLPVIQRLRRGRPKAVISIDTTQSEVAAAALDHGATIINDVSAGLDDPAMFSLAARSRCAIILMHRLRPPPADSYSDLYSQAPDYSAEHGVVTAVERFLAARTAAAIAAGIDSSSILLDPGLGFGKSVLQNMELLWAAPRLAGLGYPLLSALSRKSFVARWAGINPSLPPIARDRATLVLSQLHSRLGAAVFRVHDVAGHAELFKVPTSIP